MAQAAGPPSSATRLLGLGRRSGVVPQEGGADHRAVRVSRHHAVALTCDGDPVGAVQQGAGGLVDRAIPCGGIDFGALWMRGATLLEDSSGVGVDERRLGGLGGGVDAEDRGAHGFLFVGGGCGGDHHAARGARALGRERGRSTHPHRSRIPFGMPRAPVLSA